LPILKSLRRWLRARRLVQKALVTPVDSMVFVRPSPRIVAGLSLLGASYLFGWPAIFAAGVVAGWLKQPKILLVGPVLYGLSWLVFAASLALLGNKSISTGRALGMRLVRRFAERFLLD